MSKLYAVDVSSMFFRAFYAIPPLTAKDGTPTNALYGFLNMSLKLLRDSKSNYVVYCFDRPEPSFRKEKYEDYKANRTELPDDLAVQLPFVRELTQILGIPDIDKKTFEADDVIGTLVKMAKKNKLEVVIVSGDKDFAQLVGPGVIMHDTMRDVKYDEAGVMEKWGVKPEQMIDYLAIVGDSSDNIPGVKGVGPKGAQKLLAEFGTLENVYKNLDKITGKSLKEKLINDKKSAFLAKELVTIECDIDLGLGIKDLQLKPVDRPKLYEMLNRFNFTSLEKQFRATENSAEGADKTANALDNTFKLQPTDAAPEKKKAKVKGVSSKKLERVKWTPEEFEKNVQPYEEFWGFTDERGIYFAYDAKLIECDGDLESLGEILGPKFLQWKGFDLKDFWKKIALKRAQPPKWDAMVAAYLVSSKAIETFSDAHEIAFEALPPDLSSPEELFQMHLQMEKILSDNIKENNLTTVFETIEMRVEPALFDMETLGITLDTKELKTQSALLETDIARLEKSIQKLAGEEFNVASPKQLSVILFEKMKIKAVRKTKTGFSTDSDVLNKLADEHPIAKEVIEFRELSKLKSTYVDALPEMVSPKDGRLHTNFRQTIAATGRLSSNNPNLQNIPIRTERGRLVRKAFVAAPGKVLLSADYSQIELRVLAHIADDKALQKAFLEDLDIHSATASEVFEISLDRVTPEHRRVAKAINFGIAYGQGGFGLSEVMDVSVSEANKYIEKYFIKFSGVRDYMMTTVEEAKRTGYVETLYGRRRYMPELRASNQMQVKAGERAAINAPIQGTASDLVKKAMIELYQHSPLPMLLQVHDEVLFECNEDEVAERAPEIKKIMESVGTLKVPLKVNLAWGQNWEDAHS